MVKRREGCFVVDGGRKEVECRRVLLHGEVHEAQVVEHFPVERREESCSLQTRYRLHKSHTCIHAVAYVASATEAAISLSSVRYSHKYRPSRIYWQVTGATGKSVEGILFFQSPLATRKNLQ